MTKNFTMQHTVFLQRNVSQLDEPVYQRLHELDPHKFQVFYWNSYGFERALVDPETGLIPDFKLSRPFDYKKTWVDTGRHGVFSVFRKIYQSKPSLVVMSDIPRFERAILSILLRAVGCKTALRSDKNSISAKGRRKNAGVFERMFNLLVFNFLVPVSELTREYYSWPTNRVCVYFPYPTNEDIFSLGHSQQAEIRSQMRKKLGVGTDDYVFVSATKFVDRENPWSVIKGFERVYAKNPNTWLIALGDGELLQDIKNYCLDKKISHVLFPGFVPFRELPSYLFAADTFLHFPISEPWGASPQDALIAGLNLIASKDVGSAQVLLSGELDHFLIEATNITEAFERMDELCNGNQGPARFAPAHQNALEYTVSACAERWIKWGARTS